MDESGKTTFILSDRVYDFAKRSVQVFIPAVSSAYFGLASIWGLPGADKVVGTLAILATFGGVMLHISNKQYEASDAAYDGTAKVSWDQKTGHTKVALNIDPHDLVDKDTLKLKVRAKSADEEDEPVRPPHSRKA